MKTLTKKDLFEKYQENVKKNVKMVPPDGGWGWFIVLGSIIGMVLGAFPLFGFSILFSPILMSSAVSSTKIAWIYNVHSLIWSTYIMFVGPLCNEFGWRKVAIFGGVTNFISMLLSAFSPNADFLFFSFSLLGGIGGAASFSISFFAVPRYFVKRRGFAVGLTSMGGCLSAFLAPIVANYLLENYGYMGGSLIFAAIVLNQCVGASLYHPVEWHMIPEEIDPTIENMLNENSFIASNTSEEDPQLEMRSNSILDVRKMSSARFLSSDEGVPTALNKPRLSTNLEENKNNKNENKSKYQNLESKFINVLKTTFENLKSLKYTRVQLLAWSFVGMMLAYINFQMWIPFVITNAGYSLEMAAWCSSLSSAGNVTGRVTMTLLSDRKFFSVRYGYMFGLFITGISIIAFSLVQDSKLYMISTCCWGLGIGSALSLNTLAMISVMGVEMLPAVFGVSSLYKALSGISLGILIGVIRDATSTYTYALWMVAGAALSGFCLWLLIPWAEKFDKKKYRIEEKSRK